MENQRRILDNQKPSIIPITIENQKLPPPYVVTPKIPIETKLFHTGKKIKVYNYFALSKKNQRVYTESDALSDYGYQHILDPCESSYTNLFINGVLQPSQNYFIKRNCLILKTLDTPIENSPVTLQMIKIL